MLVLDTDHLRVLQAGGSRAAILMQRLRGHSGPVYTTVISAHENINGWQAEFNAAARASDLVNHYARLEKLLRFYGRWQVLPFDSAAETEYARLARLRLGRLGPQDLRIAAIVLTQP